MSIRNSTTRDVSRLTRVNIILVELYYAMHVQHVVDSLERTACTA